MRARNLSRKDFQLRPRASGCRAGLEAADDRQGVSPAVRLRRERERKIEIDMTARSEDGRKIEGGRQDPDYGDRLIIQCQRTADDSGIGGKTPFPQTMAQ